MKIRVTLTLMIGSALLASGCATKKYVLNTMEPIRLKLDQVGEQTNNNATAIDENSKEIKSVDQHSQSGISAVKERAMAAENAADEAMKKAAEASSAATEAKAREEKNRLELESLRGVVSSITAEDYRRVDDAIVQFAFGQDKLAPEAKQVLDKLAAGKGNLNRFVVVVEGFTDHIGSIRYNNALSERRANAVANYLVTKHHIPLYRIHMVGLGSQKPADEGKTRQARNKNRRVTVEILSSDEGATLPRRAQ